MARAHFVKKAQKNHPGGIKKGDSYYWWAFMQGGRGGPKHYSKTQPRMSQLTQSEFMGQVYSFAEALEDLSKSEPSAVSSERDSIADDIEALGQEQEDKKSNMPDGLQEGDTGQLLEGRASSCQEWAEELRGVDVPDEKDEGESDEEFQARIDEAVEALQACEYQGE